MSSKKTFRWLLILIVISLLLAGCAGSPAQPTPVPNSANSDAYSTNCHANSIPNLSPYSDCDPGN